MALRFLADHCVSNSVVQTLRETNYVVSRLRDLLPGDSSDAIVLSKAQEIDAILLSLDGDFADIVTYPPGKYKGIIALQLRNHLRFFPSSSTGPNLDRKPIYYTRRALCPYSARFTNRKF